MKHVIKFYAHNPEFDYQANNTPAPEFEFSTADGEIFLLFCKEESDGDNEYEKSESVVGYGTAEEWTFVLNQMIQYINSFKKSK